ncbi:hypothetical protein [Xylanimonas ulmi]|uniref:Flp pilus-assembly TadE/G-like protein n=1 Tax=Xylanimonas ulmi TaxID=228973 RepID=A0A4V2EYI3_9MICO|nr:hypothetical protein [Xylanibacterium ulmi]RZS63090.1 hypothetical protein EV386_3448 [Xylanibacterium ulmi]
MSVAAVPAVAGLVGLALALILMLGSATADKRESVTAADAAALAAAQEWDRRLRLVFDRHVALPDPAAWWALAGGPALTGATHEAMRRSAADYARRNGAQLVGFDVDAASRTVSVRVRHEATVPRTEARMRATASARVTLRGGLCVAGGRLGYLIDGSCVTRPAPAPEPGSPPLEDQDGPAAVRAYRSDVTLVD